MEKTIRVGFLGSGGIAQAHAYALDALKFYYSDAPNIEKAVVASPTQANREGFAARFGFQEAIAPETIWGREDIDALYILGPNPTHTPQLIKAASLPHIKRIYVEKPIGTTRQDIEALESLDQSAHGKFIMAGFQFLHKSPLRQALAHWQSGDFGELVHFRAEYLHSSYLNPSYRAQHPERLLQIPENGAAADLGSHVLSLLTAFIGGDLKVVMAKASGRLPDVPGNTDLCTTVMLEQPRSGAIGTLVASRIAAGTGDQLFLELRGLNGAILFDTAQPDCYQSYLPDEGWRRHTVYSDYLPASKFPSDYVPSGWLRALVHNHYLFLGGDPGISAVPDLAHAIIVQRLLQDIADCVLSE